MNNEVGTKLGELFKEIEETVALLGRGVEVSWGIVRISNDMYFNVTDRQFALDLVKAFEDVGYTHETVSHGHKTQELLKLGKFEVIIEHRAESEVRL